MAGGSTEWRGRSVISKVVTLLDAFTPSTPELSLGELARTTGLPVSTTYRLVSELVAWGGLERAEGGTGYRIGVRLWEIGALAPRSATLREVALPFLQDLYQATLENVHLAVLDGREALYVDTIAGRGAVPVRSRRGGRLPLHATGVGKVLLATLPRSCCGRSWRPVCAATPRTPSSRPGTCGGRWRRCDAPGSRGPTRR
jgi:DNA-binding IclR family transcriptional regulator